MSGGEFLRAVLSEDYIAARQKWYTVELQLTAANKVGSIALATLYFEKTAFYLNTNLYLMGAPSNLAGGGSVTNLTPLVDITVIRQYNSKQFSFKPLDNVQFPETINQASTWDEYNLFSPGEALTFQVSPLVAQEQLIIFALEGVEYKYSSPVAGGVG